MSLPVKGSGRKFLQIAEFLSCKVKVCRKYIVSREFCFLAQLKPFFHTADFSGISLCCTDLYRQDCQHTDQHGESEHNG